MVGVWEGLNLGSIPNFFLCFGMHPKIIDVHPKLIPKGGVVQFCPRQNCTTPPFNRNFGIFLGWHVIIWDGSQVKAFPNPDHPPLAIFLTYQAFCTGMKILHLILLRCVKLESEIFLLI